ncbi:hypothetical protein BOSP111201_14965 [Bordetella sputigena]|uniref:hypothetical protein n=1 Tax=Bordetella sputigena TaxID=1416810 RepID=UPI0039EF78A2
MLVSGSTGSSTDAIVPTAPPGAVGPHPLNATRDKPDAGRAAAACAQARRDANTAPARQVKLIAAGPHEHVGDRRQAQAIAAETMRALYEAGIHEPGELSCDTVSIGGRDPASVRRTLSTMLEAWVARMDDGEYQRLIFILAGSDYGLAPTLGAVPVDDVIMTAFTGHKLTADMKHARRLPAVVALPASEVTGPDRHTLEDKSTLVLTPGVAHDMSAESVAAAARDYQAKGYKPLPAIDGDTVTILVGGDVVERDEATDVRTLRRLAPRDARRQARLIADMELAGRKRCHFLIVSSPRSGKFLADGSEASPNPHRTRTRDAVTQAFEDTLRAYPDVRVDVFDFQHDESPSAYRPLLHAYRQASGPTGRIHVPGDSVSMVSEVASMLPGAMVIDETASMGDSQRRAADAIAAESGIAVLRRDGSIEAGKGARATPPVPAARRIADAIVARIRAATIAA